MLQVTDFELVSRLQIDNPWWATGKIEAAILEKPRRHYFSALHNLVVADIRRAVVLLGPRRVGKTVMLQQLIGQLLADVKCEPVAIAYLSLETPLYSAIPLEKLIQLLAAANQIPLTSLKFVFFDEVQYLPDWERHLKSLVDSFPSIQFVVTGSAAAALKLKSQESGAGRFTEFSLPALTFGEFLDFQPSTRALYSSRLRLEEFSKEEYCHWIEALNNSLLDYLNYGGYPEAVFSAVIRGDLSRFIKSDIIDKVLLRDLPSLYGISDIQELNRLFTTLAYNTGQELSLDGISKASGVSKPTISKYLTYLRAAFLIGMMPRIDQNARRFERVRTFKVYLTNPSMRAAMFSNITFESEHLGALIETAIYAQLVHAPYPEEFYFARWDQGEVDFVRLSRVDFKPIEAIEVKFSDRIERDERDLAGLKTLLASSKLDADAAVLTSRSISKQLEVPTGIIRVIPVAALLLTLGENTRKDRISSLTK